MLKGRINAVRSGLYVYGGGLMSRRRYTGAGIYLRRLYTVPAYFRLLRHRADRSYVQVFAAWFLKQRNGTRKKVNAPRSMGETPWTLKSASLSVRDADSSVKIDRVSQ